MTTGEIITKLIKAENYLEERMKISDEFIELVKDMMPGDYEYFREKEEAYQSVIEMMKGTQ